MSAAPITVTVSASFGAAGSVIAPKVAKRLGVRFLDRAIPAQVARQLAVPLDEALAHDDRSEHGLGRLLASFSRLAPVANGDPTAVSAPMFENEFVAETGRVIRELAAEGGVILGRAAAVVLGQAPGVLHVRLDGPEEARIEQASRILGISREDARQAQRQNDRARDAYLRHFYGVDRARSHLYHLILDSTSIPPDTCVELIVTAARARG